MNPLITGTRANPIHQHREQCLCMDALIFEIINNDYEQDLCLTSDDFQNKYYSLLMIVNEKMESRYHKINY